ncbi:endonuclease V [Scleromatobacter humisilvae]|uniref:Endonuclease V n=1 Tax=Scleromatobacter humisilvae TaxID=2897159 RepID=A0A9X1YFK4_9BURK|nr:endonuclease V [Scleromatobacter humisilvae]MCK9684540.1 endonuclease V [Scleromatobacter humisilvae]
MKLVMDVHIEADTARVAAVAFDDWAAVEGTKNYALRIEHVEKPAKGELDLRELPWLVQLLDANRLQPEVIVFDGFVHLDAQETPGLGLRLHDTLGGRTAVIGVSKSLFKGSETPDQLCIFREDETPPLVVTCAGIDLGAAKARVRMMHGRKRVPTLMKLAARIAKGSVDA